MLASSAADVTFTPSKVAGAQRFWWSYTGPAQNLAYISVHSAGGFAVIGVAGLRAGTVDVSTLLGGQPVTGVQLWTTLYSKADPIVASALHGAGFVGNVRLGKIEDGTVGCLHAETASPARCVFTPQSGAWAETPDGNYARTGQPVTLDGRPGGDYITAARINPDGTVPALVPSGHDSAGYYVDTILSRSCTIEALGTAQNATGQPIVNYATREVGTNSNPHPDGAQPTRTEVVKKPNGTTVTSYYYTGQGAALNDRDGTERDPSGAYYSGSERCHVANMGGYEAPAAKRPNVVWGKVDATSTILWRAVAAVSIAN